MQKKSPWRKNPIEKTEGMIYIRTMKEKEHYKDKAYMEVLRELRGLIATEYRNGGRLPPSREMCERFGVCLPTYGKAIERLRIDGSVYRNSNKGIFVLPCSERMHKVGLVIGDGRESPFLAFQDSIAHLLLELKQFQLHVQMIQAGSPGLIPRKALFHGVGSLIWQLDGAATAPVIEQLIRKTALPVVLMNTRDPAEEKAIHLFEFNCVHYDYSYTGEKRAEILLARGHRDIAYAGSGWFAEYTRFAPAIRNSGARLHEEFPLATEKQIRSHLADAIRKHHITGVYSEGGIHNMRAVFEVLSGLPEQERPELLVTNFEKVPALLRQYPAVRCIGKCAHTSDVIPKTAAAMLKDHLETGTPLRSVALKDFVFLP